MKCVGCSALKLLPKAKNKTFLQFEIWSLVVNAVCPYFITSGNQKHCRSDSLGFWTVFCSVNLDCSQSSRMQNKIVYNQISISNTSFPILIVSNRNIFTFLPPVRTENCQADLESVGQVALEELYFRTVQKILFFCLT